MVCRVVFQYPLRAYGLWNVVVCSPMLHWCYLSVPSAGLWAVEPPRSAWIDDCWSRFQYPLRAYGLWNRVCGGG